MNYINYGYGHMLPWGGFSPVGMASFGFFFIVLLVWSLVWKGWALWRAAKRNEKYWFIAFLIINTAGILEIIYLFVVAKEKMPSMPSMSKPEASTNEEKKG